MFQNRRYLLWLLVWGAAVYASLMIYFIPGEFSHGICGPWGCYPEIQPLAALHTAWLAGIGLPTMLAARSWPVRWARRLGWTMTALGAMGLTAITCREAITWLPQVPEEWRGYFHLRVVYTVAMLTDVPLLQLVPTDVVSAVCLACAGQRKQMPRRARHTLPRRGLPYAKGKTMSEVSIIDAIVQAHAAQATAVDADAEDTADEVAEEEAPAPDERQLNALLRKAESAFCKGNKGLLLSRVECGRWCHAIYVFRQEQGYKDREFTKQLIFNRLAVHADSKRECDANELARMFRCVEMLADGDAWKGLTVGKLTDMLPLIQRVDGSETYMIFDRAKAEQAKALFSWACGDGLQKPSRPDIAGRVLELTDPAKYAAKVEKDEQKKADKEAAKAQGDEVDDADEDEPENPENLISTEAESKPSMPNWKDVGEGMAALAQEAAKQAPGRIGDVMMDFAKRLACNSAMVKGLVAGIAEMKDAEAAQKALQELVNAVGDDYGIFADAELSEAA
jgi:hypothetical protein